MYNTYKEYYAQQAGTGITGFQGFRYQRGHGFFGRLISKAVFPLLRFLGKRAVSTGANIASDVLLNNQDWRQSTKERLKEQGKELVDEGIQKAKQYVGSGRKRKRKTIKGGNRKKKRKVIKRKYNNGKKAKAFETLF